MRKYMIGVVQMNSTDNLEKNLRTACEFVDEAAEKGAKLVSFPERYNFRGAVAAEDRDGLTVRTMATKAREHGIYVHCGSMAQTTPDGDRAFNSSIMLNPKGEIVAEYHKLHPFDITMPDGREIRESSRTKPGEQIVMVDTELGKMGLAICYDLRFPELFRYMALQGAEILFCPSNFKTETGKDHWEALLRARAIENGCYVIAAAQIGGAVSPGSFGSSLVVDPWGTIIVKAREMPCVIMAEIDLDYLDHVRNNIPCLQNRRSDVYDVVLKTKT